MTAADTRHSQRYTYGNRSLHFPVLRKYSLDRRSRACRVVAKRLEENFTSYQSPGGLFCKYISYAATQVAGKTKEMLLVCF